MDRSGNLSQRLRSALSANGIPESTQKRYRSLIRDYIRFHGKRHPAKLREPEIAKYLAHINTNMAAGTSLLPQALSAIQFLYREVLQIDLDWLDDAIRSSSSQQFPILLTRQEAVEVLDRLTGIYHLIGCLLYGSGLRVAECISLRVKDFDFENKTILIRDEAEQIQRITILPAELVPQLKQYLRNLALDFNTQRVQLAADNSPRSADPLAKAFQHQDWQAQYVFPEPVAAFDTARDYCPGRHVDEMRLHKAVKTALEQAGVEKLVSCHIFRHCFAARLLSQGQDVQTVQGLLGQGIKRPDDLQNPLQPPKNIQLISPLSQLFGTDRDMRMAQ